MPVLLSTAQRRGKVLLDLPAGKTKNEPPIFADCRNADSRIQRRSGTKGTGNQRKDSRKCAEGLERRLLSLRRFTG